MRRATAQIGLLLVLLDLGMTARAPLLAQQEGSSADTSHPARPSLSSASSTSSTSATPSTAPAPSGTADSAGTLASLLDDRVLRSTTNPVIASFLAGEGQDLVPEEL
ncbi:MAG: hypothetical protein ABI639_12165, partial [Thermoanaerobaculia bacterium]